MQTIHPSRADADFPDAREHPRVSVIVPVFNDQHGIEKLLAALRAQTYANFEVIVVDNGSTPPLDPGLAWPFSLSLLRCETPGSYAARNRGTWAATGGVLAFIDADCVPDPTWLEQGIARLTTGGERLVVGGEVLFNAPEQRSAVALYQLATGFQQEMNIQHRRFSATANLFCTTELFRELGGFDERLLSGGDREWAWRAAAAGAPTIFQPDAIVRTAPRTSLRDAIRQARRVAAGRHNLRVNALTHAGPEALTPHRSPLQAFLWLLHRDEFSLRERLSVIATAFVLRIVSLVETVRVRLGRPAERR